MHQGTIRNEHWVSQTWKGHCFGPRQDIKLSLCMAGVSSGLVCFKHCSEKHDFGKWAPRCRERSDLNWGPRGRIPPPSVMGIHDESFKIITNYKLHDHDRADIRVEILLHTRTTPIHPNGIQSVYTFPSAQARCVPTTSSKWKANVHKHTAYPHVLNSTAYPPCWQRA